MKFKTLLGAAIALGTIMLASVSAHAATFQVGTESLTGDTVSLPITAVASGTDDTLNGYIIKLTYDGSKLDVIPGADSTTEDPCYATLGTDANLAGGVFVSDRTANVNAAGEVLAVAWAKASPVTLTDSPVTIATVEFALDEGVDKSSITDGYLPVEITVEQFAPTDSKVNTGYTDKVSGKINLASVLLGDVDQNTKVDASDASLALQAGLKLITLTPAQADAGDVDGNSKVDASDASLILQRSLKLITSFPREANS